MKDSAVAHVDSVPIAAIMERYRNWSGTSGIAAYEIGSDFIRVTFRDTSRTYTYSYRRAGRIHVDTMKALAQRGSGLNKYINLYVRNLYD